MSPGSSNLNTQKNEPKQGTGASLLLQILLNLTDESNDKTEFDELELKQQALDLFKDKSKINKKAINNLLKNNYLTETNYVKAKKYNLTKKGMLAAKRQKPLYFKLENDEISALQNISNSKCYSVKSNNMVFNLKNNTSQDEIENFNDKDLQSISKGEQSVNNFDEKSKFSNLMIPNAKMKDIKKNYSTYNFQCLENNTKIEPFLYETVTIKKGDIKCFDIILYIDNREKKARNDNFSLFKRVQSMGFNCIQKQLIIGDFCWVIEIKTKQNKTYTCILDYIIERKKIDDLASSIVDGRYKDQKLRLKLSGLSKIFYLLEGYLTANNGISNKAIETAITDTRIFNKFTVKETYSTDESVTFIKNMHNTILKKTIFSINGLKDDEDLTFKATYENFYEVNKKGNRNTVSYLFLQSVGGIKGMGSQAVNWVSNYFHSMKDMHDFLQMKFENFSNMTEAEKL